MTCVGFLAFHDPPKPGAAPTPRATLAALGISTCAGHRRQPPAAAACRRGGRARRGEACSTGADVDRSDDAQLARTRRRTPTLFAEVDPPHKERIVRGAAREPAQAVGVPRRRHQRRAGAARGRRRHLGRHRGRRGQETRPTSCCSSTISTCSRDGVRRGPADFANTLKYVLITTSANFGNMVSMARRVAVPAVPPLLPTQILLSTSCPTSRRYDRDGQRRPRAGQAPRRWDIAPVSRFMFVFGLLSSVFDLRRSPCSLGFRARGRAVSHRLVRRVAADRTGDPSRPAHAGAGVAGAAAAVAGRRHGRDRARSDRAALRRPGRRHLRSRAAARADPRSDAGTGARLCGGQRVDQALVLAPRNCGAGACGPAVGSVHRLSRRRPSTRCTWRRVCPASGLRRSDRAGRRTRCLRHVPPPRDALAQLQMPSTSPSSMMRARAAFATTIQLRRVMRPPRTGSSSLCGAWDDKQRDAARTQREFGIAAKQERATRRAGRGCPSRSGRSHGRSPRSRSRQRHGRQRVR